MGSGNSFVLFLTVSPAARTIPGKEEHLMYICWVTERKAPVTCLIQWERAIPTEKIRRRESQEWWASFVSSPLTTSLIKTLTRVIEGLTSTVNDFELSTVRVAQGDAKKHKASQEFCAGMAPAGPSNMFAESVLEKKLAACVSHHHAVVRPCVLNNKVFFTLDWNSCNPFTTSSP